MRGHVLALLLASAALLSACAELSPLPTLPAKDVPGSFEQPIAAGAPIWPDKEWWQHFASPELNALITNVEMDNLDLAAAESRIIEADARARQAGAQLLPSLNGGADANHQKSGDSFGLSLSARYEFDFWGKNQDALVAAQAAAKASQADRETVALTATTGAANTYFQLLSLRDRLNTAHLNLDNAQTVLMVTQARVNDGIATPLELAQQRATIAGQLAGIPPLEQQELQARSALAVLLGRPPEGYTVAGQNLDAIALPAVAPGLPSELLVRRPDVVASEANLVAANADLAAARAAFLPSITLTGNGGLASATLGQLIDGPASSYSIGLSLAQTIFDGGALQAASDSARARQEELLSNYRSTVIGSFSEVENALGDIGHLTEQQTQQAEQLNQLQLAFNIAEARYREGVADYLTVLDAQRSLYSARDQLSQTKLSRLQAVVTLYKALGGGWRDPDASVPK